MYFISQLCSLLTDVFNKIHLNVKGALKDNAEHLRETLSECLQWIAVIVECVGMCIKQMISLNGSLDISLVQSLPDCAINVLKQTYTHCKVSFTIASFALILIFILKWSLKNCF